jgi:hypothetical protein
MEYKPEVGQVLVYVPEMRFGLHEKAPKFSSVTVVKVAREYFYVEYTEVLQARAASGVTPRRAKKLMKVTLAGWKLKDDYSSGGVYLSKAHHDERKIAVKAYDHLADALHRATAPIGFDLAKAEAALLALGFDALTASTMLKRTKEFAQSVKL